MASHKKPLGIVLIAFYTGFFSLLCIPLGCSTTMLSGMVQIPPTIMLLGLASTVMGFLGLGVTYGLWTRQVWARKFCWWYYVASIPLSGLLLMFPVTPGQRISPSEAIYQLACLAIDVIIIVYLAQRRIVNFFDQAEDEGNNYYGNSERIEPTWGNDQSDW